MNALVGLEVVAFAWGACWGSFLNVLIHRLPQGLSVVRPGSRCGSCETPIRWFDNLPILSYFVLRGRCRACKASYSPRYMLVEAACGTLALWTFRRTVGLADPDIVIYELATWGWLQVYIYALVAIAFIDLEHTLIPDVISFPALGIGLLGAFLLPGLDGWTHLWGALAGGGFLLLVAGVGYLVFKREAMGLGDVILIAVIGAFVGWQPLPLVLLLGSTQALLGAGLAGLWTRITGRRDGLVMTTAELDARFGEEDRYHDLPERHAVPFGPFLALSGLEVLIFGAEWFWVYAARFAALIGLGP